MKKNRTIVFFGTPLIAAKCLEAIKDKGYEILSIVCQPDKPIGRKKEMLFCETKKFGIENNILILQPNKLIEIEQKIKDLNPDLILTCAYGKIIPESILKIPKFKCINVHASLLPKYRGGAPIHWALINGDEKTGITLMFMEKGMDTGNMILNYEIPIDITDNLDTLFTKMENLAYKIVFENIENLFDENLVGMQQDESAVSFAYNIKRMDERIDWNKTALQIYNHIRGLSAKIGAYTTFNEKDIKIFESEIIEIDHNQLPGTIIENNKKLIVAASKDALLLKAIQFSGKAKINQDQIKAITKNFELGKQFS